MKRIFTAIIAMVVTNFCLGSEVSHPFVCGDILRGQVIKMDATGKAVWTYDAKVVCDVWALPNGNILFSGPATGAVEVTPDKKVVWQYKGGRGEKIYGCQPLPNGDVMIAVFSKKSPRIIEVGRDGAINTSFPLQVKKDIRLARKTKRGTYLLAARQNRAVHEYDADGKLIRNIKVPGNVYLAVELENGNILVACGDGHTIVEIDPNDKIVWQIKEKDLPGHPLRFVAGFQRLPNGNTVICNWGGHGHTGKQAQIFEVTQDKKVVWEIFDNKQLGTTTHIQLLDIKGDCRSDLFR